MSFDEFQNRCRLYVIGALETDELEDFEKARKVFACEIRVWTESVIGEGIHHAVLEHSLDLRLSGMTLNV